MITRKLTVFLCGILFFVSGVQAQQKNMLIYCGITMVRPITELARLFEKRENVKVQIAQGGSEDLFQSAKKSRLGDLYFPGEPSYLNKHRAEGLFGPHRIVGYNQMAIVVPKGNPKRVKGDVRELLRKDLAVMIGSAESGSVGQQARTTLEDEKIYEKVIANTAALMPDPRALNLAIKRGEADVALNWRATAYFPDNAMHIEAIDLSPKVATPQALYLIRLSFSRYPELSQRFMDLVASEAGQAVFRKYGFLDNRSR